MTEKKCPLCNQTKPVSEYYIYFVKARNKERVSYCCRKCEYNRSSANAKKLYQKKKIERLQYAKEYREKNPEKVKNSKAKFTKKYREELKECYVAYQASKTLKCSTKEIYDNPELMKAYKTNLQIKRLIKKNGKK